MPVRCYGLMFVKYYYILIMEYRRQALLKELMGVRHGDDTHRVR
jgi:hypothetical protein